ncbi:AzlD domain-containing protein [Paenibacillus xerothermodurans]|uniref:AzlD domain-containing protein n=1 Tax=Paenibacillus xerothermodurans TaxID=1977292 RepID=A0A2W1N8G1_PAEXE|nr:AzlD domain-containing protein [Paenibacillus xerothermodurans]PZE19930.1 AzlD domain-containing protein [Paenibacillus xerothermodurans]
MEIRWHIFLLIVGAAAVTFIPRIVPLAVLSRFQLPAWAMQWLNHVPIAIMAALVGQELFTHDGRTSLFSNNIELLGGILTFAAAIWTRSLLITVVIGIVCMLILRMMW